MLVKLRANVFQNVANGVVTLFIHSGPTHWDKDRVLQSPSIAHRVDGNGMLVVDVPDGQPTVLYLRCVVTNAQGSITRVSDPIYFDTSCREAGIKDGRALIAGDHQNGICSFLTLADRTALSMQLAGLHAAGDSINMALNDVRFFIEGEEYLTFHFGRYVAWTTNQSAIRDTDAKPNYFYLDGKRFRIIVKDNEWFAAFSAKFNRIKGLPTDLARLGVLTGTTWTSTYNGSGQYGIRLSTAELETQVISGLNYGLLFKEFPPTESE